MLQETDRCSPVPLVCHAAAAVCGPVLTGHRAAYMVLLLYHWPPPDDLMAERPNRMSYLLRVN
jgi:hypothetical protein